MSAVVSFDAIKATAEAALEIAKTIKVTDAESAAQAKIRRDELKAILQRVEDIRKEGVKPIDQARAEWQAKAKAISGPIEAGKKGVELELMRWQAEERAKAEAIAEAERKAAEARLAEAMANDDATLDEVEHVAEQVAIASAGEDWEEPRTIENPRDVEI